MGNHQWPFFVLLVFWLVLPAWVLPLETTYGRCASLYWHWLFLSFHWIALYSCVLSLRSMDSVLIWTICSYPYTVYMFFFSIRYVGFVCSISFFSEICSVLFYWLFISLHLFRAEKSATGKGIKYWPGITIAFKYWPQIMASLLITCKYWSHKNDLALRLVENFSRK